MRKLTAIAFTSLAVALAIAVPANAGTSRSRTAAKKLSLAVKITGFTATSNGVIGTGIVSGALRSGSSVARSNAPARFSVVSGANSRRCNILTLRLAPVELDLLGVQVTTSYISLDVYAVPGRVLGNLFCGLAHARISFPRAARDLTAHLARRPLHVMSAGDTLPAHFAQAAGSCQVLKLVLGPLHLDLLGLVVDLYGKKKVNPVVVKITADPSQGLLGQLLCGLAGGTGITDVAGLQSFLSTLGVNLNTNQVTNLLNQLGLNLTNGLSQSGLNQILAALGLGSKTPSG